MIDKEYIQKAKKNGLLIHPYTINSQVEMEQLIQQGATGAFTDFSDTLSEVIGN